MPVFVRQAVTEHVGLFGIAPHEVLCRTPRRTLLRRDYFNREIWKPAIAAAGLPVETTFHDLRHTFASTALAEGVPISEVSHWLGHKPITTTVDLYGHPSPRPAGVPVTRWTRHSGSGAKLCEPRTRQPPAVRLATRADACEQEHCQRLVDTWRHRACHHECARNVPCPAPGWVSAQARAWVRGEPACRPGSVHPRERGPTAIHLGLPLPAASCGLPASIGRAALNRSRRPRAPEGARPL